MSTLSLVAIAGSAVGLLMLVGSCLFVFSASFLFDEVFVFHKGAAFVFIRRRRRPQL